LPVTKILSKLLFTSTLYTEVYVYVFKKQPTILTYYKNRNIRPSFFSI